MTALLILLGLFSVTIVISNLGVLKRTRAFSYVSIPLMIGLVFSDEGLLPLLPSTKESLIWALRVGLTWFAFLAGTRLSELSLNREGFKKLMPVFVGYLPFLGAGFLIMEFSHLGADLNIKFAMALFLTAALFSSKENPFLLGALFLSLFFLFPPVGDISFGFLDMAYPVGLGLLMGVVCRLIIEPNRPLDTPTRLTLVGLCVLGSGWSIGMGILEVLFGLSLGWALSWVHKYGICKDPNLKASGSSVGFVIALFAGTYIGIDLLVVLVGVTLVFLRAILKWILFKMGLREASRKEVLSQVLPISPLALPIILSLHLSPFGGESTSFLLSAFCIGFVVNDFFGLFVELLNKKSLKEESPS